MAFAAGCYQQPDPPRQFVPGNDLYEQFTSEGDRVVIRAPTDDAAELKIRDRTRETRVYDDNMAPVGRVGADDDGVHQRTVDGQTERRVKAPEDDRVRLADRWRATTTNGTWTIYDADDTRLATWRADEDGWTMDRPSDSSTWRVERDDGDVRVVADDASSPLIEARSPGWSDPRLLALTLDELEALDRYTLAVWADRHLPEQ